MRYLILSDIHSNLEALEACVQRAKQASYDSVLCCGDIVGYGPSPVEAIDGMRALNALTIRGSVFHNADSHITGIECVAAADHDAQESVHTSATVFDRRYTGRPGSQLAC